MAAGSNGRNDLGVCGFQ